MSVAGGKVGVIGTAEKAATLGFKTDLAAIKKP
jgi:hypothetical protein